MPRHGRPQKVTDLFPTDEPVPDRMIGRRQEVTELATALVEGVNQLVAGPRRSGKTTVCEAALARLQAEPGCYTVEVDLFTLSGLPALARALVAGLVANRSGARRGASAARTVVHRAAGLAGAVASAKLRSAWGVDVEIAFDLPLSERDPRGALEKALYLLQSVAEADQRDIVLFVDEFQEIAGPRQVFGDPDDVTQLMRGVLQHSPSVACLFAGSAAHLMRDLFSNERRAFYRFGSWYELQPISIDDWVEGLSSRFEQGQMPVRDAAIHSLLAQSEGHVRTTMLLAQQSFLAALVAGDGEVTTDHTVVALEMAMKSEAAALAKDIERLRDAGRYALGICQAIAQGRPPYSQGSSQLVNRAIETLQRIGFIEQRGTPGRGGWVVIDPLLRRRLADLP